MTEELKSCPFCDLTPLHVDLNVGSQGTGSYVLCGNCGARGPCGPYGSEDWVIKRWNTRAEPDELPGWLVDSVKTRIAELQNSCDHYREHPTAQDLIYISSFVIRELFSILEMHKPEEQ